MFLKIHVSWINCQLAGTQFILVIKPIFSAQLIFKSFFFLLGCVSTFQEKVSAHALQRNQKEPKAVKLTFGSTEWWSRGTTG